jgi:5'-3' exonuclease
MATFATHEKGPIRVVTGDRDLFQLVDDKKDIKSVYLARGISQHDLVDTRWVADKYAIPGDRYALFAMFRGDPSDGLPGVKGIGEKGAALIANSFATVDEALKGAKNGDQSLPPALAKKIIAGEDYLKIAPTLVHCARDVALPKMDISLPSKPADLSQVYQMKEEYRLGASVDRLISALGW